MAKNSKGYSMEVAAFCVLSALIYYIYKIYVNRREKGTEMESQLKIYRFGEDTPCITVCKNDGMMNTLQNIAKVLGSPSNNLQLFQNCFLLPKSGMLSDHLNTGPVHVIKHQSCRNVYLLGCPVFDKPDMLLYDDGPCIQMACGHFITPESLYNYCLKQLESGSINITCPKFRDEENLDEACNEIWQLEDIEGKACLSDDERILFQILMNNNWIQRQNNIYSCPSCTALIDGTNLKGRCFNCRYCSINACRSCKQVVPRHQMMCINVDCKESLEKLRRTLIYCERKTLLDVENCPSVRACPSCYLIVQHEGDNCKHMECPNIHCKTKFCFICLKIKTDKYYWPCGGAFESCRLSPVQSVE